MLYVTGVLVAPTDMDYILGSMSVATFRYIWHSIIFSLLCLLTYLWLCVWTWNGQQALSVVSCHTFGWHRLLSEREQAW